MITLYTKGCFEMLSNCDHICLKYVHKRRSTKQLECKTIKSFRECQTTFNFVIPTEYWAEQKAAETDSETQGDKDKDQQGV